MIHDNDFYVMLPSNASSNLFPTNSKSHYRVALPRQIHLKDEEDWEVGLHHVVYPLSWFDVPRECKHSHLMVRRSDDFKLFTLPEGKYQTALDVVEGILQCLNNVAPSSHYEVTVDEEWNIALTFLNEWLMITASVAQALGWITEDHIIRPSVRLDMNVSLNPTPKFGYHWCSIPPNVTITFPGRFVIPPSVQLCPCKHKVIQLQTNLVEPWQVGDKRLPLLHEMVPCGKFRETMLEEREHLYYLPLRTKTFQTVEIYLTSGCGQLLSFLDGIVNVVLHFRRRTP
nr:TPA_asm: penton-1 [Rhodactis coral adintovirus]